MLIILRKILAKIVTEANDPWLAKALRVEIVHSFIYFLVFDYYFQNIIILIK